VNPEIRFRVPDDVYAAFAAHFSDEEQVRISMVIGAINVFNRLNVGFKIRPRVSSRRGEG